MQKKIRIAIYSRKSKYSSKGDSIGNQVELVMEYIKMHYPEKEVETEKIVYEDEGFSGGNLDRPKFQELLRDERKNPYDILICYRLDRISRNIADFSNLINELANLGTSFVSIKEQFDTKTPMGRAMMYIASVFAQLEREVIAERIRDNMLELAKTGRWLGGDPPTGYKSESHEIVQISERNADNTIERKTKKACKLVTFEEEKQKVILIFKKYLELKSLSKLELYLMENDILSRKEKNYSITTLRAILTNPVYLKNDENAFEFYSKRDIQIYTEPGRNEFNGKYGLLSYNKADGIKKRPIQEWIIAVGLHEGFISGSNWTKVQDLLEKNADKKYRSLINTKNNTIFSGILRCKCCGGYMRPKTGTAKNSEGKIKYYYACVLKEKSRGLKCKGANVYGNELDTKIIEKLKEIVVPNLEIYKELKNMNLSKDNDNDDEIITFKKAYDKNKDEIQKLVDKIKYVDTGVMEFINEELKKLKKNNEELQIKISKIEQEREDKKVNNTREIEREKFIPEIVNSCFDVFDKLDIKYKKDIINLFVENAYGNGDKIEINLK